MVRGEGDEGWGPVGRLAEGRSGSKASGGVADWWLCEQGGHLEGAGYAGLALGESGCLARGGVLGKGARVHAGMRQDAS